MLSKLRNKKIAKKVWIILAIVVVPPFILWGSGSLMRNRDESGIAGKIFGRAVSALEYKEALEATKTKAIMQFGDKLSEVEKYLDLQGQAWERIMLLREAAKRRINAKDKEVIQAIAKYPFFQRNSVFDDRLYQEMLRYVFRVMPRTFEEQVRQDIIMKKLYDETTKAVTVKDSEVQDEYRKANEEMSLNYIAGLAADFTKNISPTEEEIREYFTKNSLQFRQPLSFNVEYLTIQAKDKEDPEAKSKIKSLKALLDKKTSFLTAAKETGLTLKVTGLFMENGPIPGIGWMPEVSNMISRSKPGDLIGPIYAENSYFFMRLAERKEPYIPELETIKDAVKNAYVREKSLEIAKGKTEDCLKKLKQVFQANPKAVDLERAAKDCRLKYDTTKAFKFGSYIEGIGASDPFWTKALALPENGFSDIIAIPAGFYIVKLKSKTNIDEKKFAQEKKEFTDRLLAQKRQEYFTKYVTALQEKAKRF
ncbi:MAG: SurA N-terminal domain-containing protein [Candidatus Omnitrophica bacterium]|nr:SurA N-terminal domain-containing protein [Candidatus Omnitrophota bacterium]